MSDRRRDLDVLLRASEGDVGCTAGEGILDAYVELELAGRDPARVFPGTAIHLQSCPGCQADHEGLLAAARLFGDASHRIVRWLMSPEGFADAAAGSGHPDLLLALEEYMRTEPSDQAEPEAP